jgi:hypothetical protein
VLDDPPPVGQLHVGMEGGAPGAMITSLSSAFSPAATTCSRATRIRSRPSIRWGAAGGAE